jgi:hypothetical protein
MFGNLGLCCKEVLSFDFESSNENKWSMLSIIIKVSWVDPRKKKFEQKIKGDGNLFFTFCGFLILFEESVIIFNYMMGWRRSYKGSK